MSKSSSRGNPGGSNSSRSVSASRLHQRSGARNSFGGYTKVNKGNGRYVMEPTASKKSGSGK